MANSWDEDATFGSDIIGIGSAFGNLRGKVKTAQIGFIRSASRQVRKQGRVPVSGRGKASATRAPKVKGRN